MRWFLKETALLALAAALSWWLFLGWPSWSLADPRTIDPRALPIAVMPELEAAEAPQPPEKPDESQAGAQAQAQDQAPPPPERGTPEGKEGAQAAPQALMQDQELLARAQQEASGEVRRGFETVLLAAAEDQLDIARFFGEELVLVPRSAIDQDNTDPRYFRLTGGERPVVKQVRGRPPLPKYRQYRDLFDYEYARLPAPLRELRRSVLVRSEVYLFSALIPVAEWAVVIARRQAALARAGRELGEARRFTLRSRRLPDNAFDVEGREILFQDGRRFRPRASRGALQK